MHCLSNAVYLLIPSSDPSHHLEEGIQREEESGYNPVLQWLQEFNETRSQLQSKLNKQTQKLAHKYKDQQLKLERKHKRQQARMVHEGHTAFQGFFLMTNLANPVKLLPWCISSSVPLHYLDEALASTLWQGRDAQTTTAAPGKEEPPTPGPSHSPTHLTETPPHHTSPTRSPLSGHSPMGKPFFESTAGTSQKKLDHSPSGSYGNHWDKRTCIHSPEAEGGSKHSLLLGSGITSKLVLEAGPSTVHWGQEPASPPFSPSRAIIDLDDGIAAGSSWSTGDHAPLDSDSSRKHVLLGGWVMKNVK